jgi:hypothetical protein
MLAESYLVLEKNTDPLFRVDLIRMQYLLPGPLQNAIK